MHLSMDKFLAEYTVVARDCRECEHSATFSSQSSLKLFTLECREGWEGGC